MPCTSCNQPNNPYVRKVRLIAAAVVGGVLAIGCAVGALVALFAG